MSIKVAVISPISHSGTTMASIYMGQALAHTQAQSVVLTYTGTTRHMCNYIGVNTVEDKTRSISQVIKLLESRAIGSDDLYDYTVKVYPNMHIMDTADDAITEEDALKLMSYVYDNVPSSVTICDVATQIYDEVTQRIFELSDVIVVVIQPDTHSYDMIVKWMKSNFWPKSKDVMVLVNRYNEEIAALRDISKRIGVAHMNVCKLHYNPYITKLANSGESLTIFPWIMEKDPRVVELNTDMKEICQYLMSKAELRFKWEG